MTIQKKEVRKRQSQGGCPVLGFSYCVKREGTEWRQNIKAGTKYGIYAINILLNVSGTIVGDMKNQTNASIFSIFKDFI